jgi:tetratricopeptide (TPR) repeat protein
MARDRDIIEILNNYLESEIAFKSCYEKYKAGNLRFKDIRKFVSDERELSYGYQVASPLFNLKQICHDIIGDPETDDVKRKKIQEFANGVRTIFHLAEETREEVYYLEKLERYETEEAEEFKGTGALVSARLKESCEKISDYYQSLRTKGLLNVLSEYKEENLIARWMTIYKKLVDKALGKDGLQQLAKIYDNGVEELWFRAGESYRGGGFYREAANAFSRVLKINPRNEQARAEYELCKNKID